MVRPSNSRDDSRQQGSGSQRRKAYSPKKDERQDSRQGTSSRARDTGTGLKTRLILVVYFAL